MKKSDYTIRDFLMAAGLTLVAVFSHAQTDARAPSVPASSAAEVAPTCPCSIWPVTATPANPSASDTNPVELGVKFRSDAAGYITGIRFYKGAGNSGAHVGNLWSSTGTLLATATFSAESASGWQQVNFATPVAISADTVYVASYFAPNGGYAYSSRYFAAQGLDNAPLHALQNGVSGGNGVYLYGATGGFPSATYDSSNYWVDVVFSTTGDPDTTPPTVTGRTPSDGATGVSMGTAITATFSEAMNATTLSSSTFELRDASNALVPATVTFDAGTNTATLTPSSRLALNASYSATVKGGAAEPRVADVAGNALDASVTWSFTTVASDPCETPANQIVAENCMPGNAPDEWDVSGSGDPSIQGFATDISVNRGQTVFFKINTDAATYHLDIYRLGYYGGAGARKITTVQPSAVLPQAQPFCLDESTTGLVDCGNWNVSASWTVPADATSGIYFARAVRTDTGGASHIVFIVRDDTGNSDLLFKTSDTTWQAYNDYGGNSLYVGSPANRAYKVSYNRPFQTRGNQYSRAWLFGAEYPMVRWIEANGYNVSYFTSVDADRSGDEILEHKAFLSVGHDEYWSAGERASVEAARDAGVNLTFFSGNEMFWKTRWEASIDGSGTPHRTLVSYKETLANAAIDPQDPPTWTGTWRDPRFSPPADGGRPENELTGTIFTVNCCQDALSITVPEAYGKLRFWRNTSIATLAPGQVATLPRGVLGYEWDEPLNNGFEPAGLVKMSSTTESGVSYLQDYGSSYGSGTATHSLTLYRHSSGALVFGAGTIRWSWGLDGNHDFDSATPSASTTPDVRMQQATINLLADMGAQPRSLQGGLIAASQTTDRDPPVSAITSPAGGSNLQSGIPVTISGTSTDSGGGLVASVEVSVDGGASWKPATGGSNWSYSWTPSTLGSVTIRSRAADDSANLEGPGSGGAVTVTVSSAPPQTCPCSIWPVTATPANPSASDADPLELGVKFTSDTAGYITGIRFYKGAGNSGTHVGNLWSSTGTLLATATFSAESASGWQQVNFATPVAISADTVYVASYFAPNGGYAYSSRYFAAQGLDNAPLHALQNGVSGGNGVYLYSATGGFPNATYNSNNYWVDVVFERQ